MPQLNPFEKATGNILADAIAVSLEIGVDVDRIGDQRELPLHLDGRPFTIVIFDGAADLVVTSKCGRDVRWALDIPSFCDDPASVVRQHFGYAA